MKKRPPVTEQNEFLKAKDLKVIVNFELDSSPEGKQRSKQAKLLICEMILLAKKRGRPSQKEENLHEVA